MAAPLIDRLRIKPGMTVLLLNAPDDFAQKLEPLPADVTLETRTDGLYAAVIAVFRNQAEANDLSATAAGAVRKEGLLWTCYPKTSGALKTDLTRDKGWAMLYGLGWGPVSQIAVDADWSALRWRPESDVQRKGGKTWSERQRTG